MKSHLPVTFGIYENGPPIIFKSDAYFTILAELAEIYFKRRALAPCRAHRTIKKATPFGMALKQTKSHTLSTLGVATICTDQATFSVDKIIGTAFFALLTFLGLGSVGDVFLQGADHAGAPRIDRFVVKPQGTDQVDGVHHRHAVPEYS